MGIAAPLAMRFQAWVGRFDPILEQVISTNSQAQAHAFMLRETAEQSRYQFEKEVFKRRAKAELSADYFCDIMSRAQQATCGSGLDDQVG